LVTRIGPFALSSSLKPIALSVGFFFPELFIGKSQRLAKESK